MTNYEPTQREVRDVKRALTIAHSQYSRMDGLLQRVRDFTDLTDGRIRAIALTLLNEDGAKLLERIDYQRLVQDLDAGK